MQGRSTDTNLVKVQMESLLSAAKEDAEGRTALVISKKGPGRLYYRMGLKYAPSDLNLAPLNYGFKIVRSYEV